MTTTAEAAPTVLVPFHLLLPDAANPRGEISADSLEELAASIRTHGVLQPLIVRDDPSIVDGEDGRPWRVVCGHRRLAAAKLAGLESVPVQLVRLTDQEVRELQLVENLQRADIHPLEEAEGFLGLSRRFSMSAATIAEKVGKSEGYVLRRMKLAGLPAAARKAFRDGKLSLSHVQEIARIPNEKVAAEATKTLLELAEEGEGGEITAASAALVVRDEFMLELKTAVFPVADATLRPAAGACTECPKRTGNQKLLFADVADDDLCTDPACFREKMRAHGDRALAAAKAAGATILGKGETKQIFRAGYYHDEVSPSDLARNAPYVEPDGTADDIYEFRKHRRTLLKGKELPPSVWAVDPRTGLARELWRKDEWQKAAKAAGLVKSDGRGSAATLTAQEKASRKRMAEKAALESAVSDATIAAFVRSAEQQLATVPQPILVGLARAAVGRAWHDTLKRVVARRGLDRDADGKRPKKKAQPVDVLDDYLRRCEAEIGDGAVVAAAGLLVEVLVAPALSGGGYRLESRSLRQQVEQAFGIDTKKIAAQVREEREAAKIVRVPAGAKRKGKAKAKRTAKPGTCRVCGCTDDAACPEGCSWANQTHTLCTSCAEGDE